ncbi:hypothetical protein GM556_04100 [Bombella sp. ESL0378]|uniref:translocation/assembly module TamB domain-containing protein n=1 Tax=Bombella sp. ESL0378 TaxID=2676442 RepID=UPI0012DA01F1|nr:translocation/assembly module TamB domain-containing protein [Bombella sp. ESL0378]MUG04729.1 hypothetical protein [Bombella sp. ESL0378]
MLFWRRFLRYSAYVGIVLDCVVIVALIGINLPPTKRFIEHKVPNWTGGMVAIEGMQSVLPWHLSLAHIVLKDQQGIWLEGRGLELRLSLFDLLGKTIRVRTIAAETLDYKRNPVFPPSPPSSHPSTGLPAWGVRLDKLAIPRLTLGPSVMGQAVSMQLSGDMQIKDVSAFSKPISFADAPPMQLHLFMKRLDNPAYLRLHFRMDRHQMMSNVHYDESVNGFAAMPGTVGVLDPLSIDVTAEGPYEALKTNLAIQAAMIHQATPLLVILRGELNLIQYTHDLHFSLNAPAMTLRPGLGWESLMMEAELHGPLRAPYGTVKLEGAGLLAAGAGIGHMSVQFEGQGNSLASALDDTTSRQKTVGGGADHLALSARFDGISLPGKASSLLASAPLTIEAMLAPQQEGKPYQIHIKHEAMALDVTGKVENQLSGHVQLAIDKLPDLTALMGQKVEGTAHLLGDFTVPLRQSGALSAALGGQFGIDKGPPPLMALIGPKGTLTFHLAQQNDGAFLVKQAALTGRGFQLEGAGQLDAKRHLSSSVKLSLPDLEALHKVLRGHAALQAELQGPLDDMAVHTRLAGALGVVHPSASLPVAPLEMTADVAHLPSHPQGMLHIEGMLDRAPLIVDTQFERASDGTIKADLHKLAWKDAQGRASLLLPAGTMVPQGEVMLNVPRLDIFSRLIGQSLTGHLHVDMENTAHDHMQIALDGQAFMKDYAVKAAHLQADLHNITQNPNVVMNLHLTGVRFKEITGAAQLSLKGPQTALDVQARGAFENVMHAPARFDAAAQLHLPEHSVRVDRALASIKGDRFKLTAPAIVRYGADLAVEHMAVELSPPHGVAGRVFLNGTIKPNLVLEARLEHITPALAAPFLPALQAEGDVSAAAKLRGTLASPTGRFTVEGRGLRFISAATASLPAGQLHIEADLAGTQALLHTTFRAGEPLVFILSGKVPLSPTGQFAVAAKGRADLSIANAFLGADGMGAGGQLDLDLGVNGLLKQPQLTGSIQLHNGSFEEYADGVHVEAGDGLIKAQGDRLTIEHFTARAGQGSLGVTGQIGALQPGLPVDVHFTMDKAQPVQSDLLTELIDSRLHIYGQAATRLDVEGDVTIPEAAITIPDSMPASVPQLEIITPEQTKTPVKPPPKMIIGLNVNVMSPGALFVRGHGLFAEMQGKLHIGGLSTAPVVTGGISLKQGNFNLAGINLNFTRGEIGFSGASAVHKLDPTIDFRADRNADGTLASLLVRGYASEPKFEFVSNPQLPRDEVLSILLFGTKRSSLSPAQLASLGVAVVQIGGGSAFDPMSKVRNGLGLDHLAIGGGSSVGNGGTSLEAGKYITKRVYVGAREGLSSKGTQAQVKVDLTKRLQLNTTIGTGGQVTGFTTPENDPGSSIGLSYGIDY